MNWINGNTRPFEAGSDRRRESEQQVGSELTRIGSRKEVAHVLYIQLLSEFKVYVGERLVEESEWYLRKARNLVKLLALAPNHRMHRGILMAALWPDLETQAATNNLHKALHLARRTLEPDLPAKSPSAYLHMTGEFVALAPSDAVWIDVDAFRSAVEVARNSRDLVAYKAALHLYTGDLLPEDRYEEWVIRDREELEATYLAVLLEFAELQERRDQTEAAVETLRRLVARDPAHEAAQARLMHLLARSGRRQLALRQYVQFRDALRRELDVDPEPTVQTLYQEISKGEIVRGSSLITANSSSPERPDRTTGSGTLVGRDPEMAQLEQVLNQVFQGHGSIALLSGEAGIGKSRLAAEIRSQAEAGGAISLWGAAYQHWREVPYGPFRVALESFAMRVSPDTLEALIGDSVRALARLAPAIALMLDLDQDPYVSPFEVDEPEIRASVSNFLVQLSAQAPIVIVLEDVQVADEASLRLLQHLAAVIRSLPVLIVCTFRSDEVSLGSGLDRLVESVERTGLGISCSLSPLGYEPSHMLVTSLLGGSVHWPVLDLILRVADGNPHYIEEAVYALRGRNRIHEVNGMWSARSGIIVPLDRDHLRQSRRASGDFRLARRLRAMQLDSVASTAQAFPDFR